MRKKLILGADASNSYILKIDLGYPKELHNAHSDFPLASDQLKVRKEWMSERPHKRHTWCIFKVWQFGFREVGPKPFR